MCDYSLKVFCRNACIIILMITAIICMVCGIIAQQNNDSSFTSVILIIFSCVCFGAAGCMCGCWRVNNDINDDVEYIQYL
jgi:RsiW-degrading membrane proteinase PrsW (M82 family)